MIRLLIIIAITTFTPVTHASNDLILKFQNNGKNQSINLNFGVYPNATIDGYYISNPTYWYVGTLKGMNFNVLGAGYPEKIIVAGFDNSCSESLLIELDYALSNLREYVLCDYRLTLEVKQTSLKK
ncbi:hypothetical protein [Vibrio crassostreae]|uniref:hypothetical protein n=1 Tax=Vibrio crassostreae TaxID=246167 RepID=UPI001B314A09|nr:hypothetical protein [Vibrio crassostreae]